MYWIKKNGVNKFSEVKKKFLVSLVVETSNEELDNYTMEDYIKDIIDFTPDLRVAEVRRIEEI
jgi:hypothetical protein